MTENTVVCENCLAEYPESEAPHPDSPCAENEHGGHDWSEPTPLGRLLAMLEHHTGLQVLDYDENEQWYWVEATTRDPDRVGASESLATIMKSEGFRFSGVSEPEEPGTYSPLRFNYKRS